jgi:hypothetical protein
MSYATRKLLEIKIDYAKRFISDMDYLIDKYEWNGRGWVNNYYKDGRLSEEEYTDNDSYFLECIQDLEELRDNKINDLKELNLELKKLNGDLK